MKFDIKSGVITAQDVFLLDVSDHEVLSNLFAQYLSESKIFPSDVTLAHFVLSIVSEKEIAKINKRFRRISKPTDVLSFPLWENSSWNDAPELWSNLPLGDIFICPAQVAKNAVDNSVTERQEMVLDLCHGFLHLLGHDHFDEEEKKVMWQEQDKLLTRFFNNEKY